VKLADKLTPEAAEERSRLQAALLAAAAERVRPGGALCYAVCTPLPEEGPAIVSAFLHAEAGAAFERVRLDQVAPWLPADALDEQGAVQLRTFKHHTDGFYVARMRRRA
jgi:16S rRNA (cytosine967-C5)-methyltransferase